MSIRNRIATFEARNQELRQAIPNVVRGGGGGDLSTATLTVEEPRIVTPSSTSVAGRFGSTTLSPTSKQQLSSRRRTQKNNNAMEKKQQPMDDSQSMDEPTRVQRYQPLHHQYQQRQRQQRRQQKTRPERATPLLQPPEGADTDAEPSPSRTQHRYLPGPKRKDERATSPEKPNNNNLGRMNRPSATEGVTSKFAKTSTAQRLAKIQRMQRNRSLEKQQQQYRQQERLDATYEPSSPSGLPRDLSLQPSAADDEITLTSVRQIVGTAHSSASPNKNTKRVYPNEMTYTDDRDYWPEEKSDKPTAVHHTRHHHLPNTSVSTTSSSDDVKRLPAIQSQLTPDVTSFFEESQRRFLHPNSPANATADEDDDEEEDDDDVSQGSESFAQRKERERLEQVAREAAVEKAKAELEGPFLKAEDVDYYQKSMDTPVIKTAAGVAVAATLGCIALGPVGLLVGAAAVGIGVGIMQIPAEQRQNLEDKASRTLRQVSDTALQASESLSNACAASYQDSGLADHVPDEVNNCCAVIREAPTNTDKSEMSGLSDTGGAQPPDAHEDLDRTTDEVVVQPRLPPRRAGAACLRDGPFTPVNLIYTLNPGDQPRAWLDVLASAETTHDEKMEALEEIMILAKDKSRARVLVEEGILDSIMWTLGRYFEKLYGPEDHNQSWANPEITAEEARMAKLSANCCLQLGKAYCAAMHTDGDLMLMSLYERGTVPEERQLAQMLHEVPYHTRVTKTRDPTIVDPAGEVFAVAQMSLPQAEDFARSVKALAHGQSYQM